MFEAVFDAYVAAGGNFIDTANVCADGRNEELLGGFVAQRRLRNQLVQSRTGETGAALVAWSNPAYSDSSIYGKK